MRNLWWFAAVEGSITFPAKNTQAENVSTGGSPFEVGQVADVPGTQTISSSRQENEFSNQSGTQWPGRLVDVVAECKSNFESHL